MSASLGRDQVGPALRHGLERLVDEGERALAVVKEHRGMKGSTARIPMTDANGEPCFSGICIGHPAERVGGQLATRTDELAERSTIHALGVPRGGLGKAPFLDLDLEPLLASTEHRASVSSPIRCDVVSLT
ncbi:hypothetical protein [Nocardioides sp. GCM10030258]|uniref:hypothetical protein n=1 Tax=unclassified Nocardioides TaxID=2615069 RepID=UPI00361731E0